MTTSNSVENPATTNLNNGRGAKWLLVIASICLLCTAVYAVFVCVPGLQTGELIWGRDMYAPYAGLHAIVNGQNPYSHDITLDIQRHIYGYVPDMTSGFDQQAFAYPVFLVFIFAPLGLVSFSSVQVGLVLFALAGASLSILLWLRNLDIKGAWNYKLALVFLALCSVSTVIGVIVGQLSMFISVLLAVATLALVRKYYFLAGVLLTLATIKPQLSALLILGLVVWALCSFKQRQGLIWGLAATMSSLLVGAELVSPGWIPQFISHLSDYSQYVNGGSPLTRLFGAMLGSVLTVAVGLGVALMWAIKGRGAGFAQPLPQTIALTLALTVLVIPNNQYYNQILFLPVLLLLAYRAPELWRAGGRLVRYSYLFAGVVVVWPWLMSVLLAVAFLGSLLLGDAATQSVLALYSLPFYAVILMPLVTMLCVAAVAWHDRKASPDQVRKSAKLVTATEQQR